MTLTATIAPGAPAGTEELQHALANARVVFISEPGRIAAMATALADPSYAVMDEVIARGSPAKHGVAGWFEPAFPVGIQPGHIDAEGNMDFFDREMLKPVLEGDYLGQLHAPIPAVPGRRLDGAELRVAPVSPSKLRLGQALRVDDTGRVYAAIAGAVMYSAESKLDVIQQHAHQGDVDMRSGNLDMQGALVVRGSVQRAFHARATGDLVISGAVDAGTAYAGGSLRIRGGVRGGQGTTVCAQGDLECHHAEAAHLRCGGTLALESAINSELAAQTIRIARLMRGGKAEAETSVTVREIGLAHGTGTSVAAGIPLQGLDIKRAIAAVKGLRTMQRRAGDVRRGSARPKGGKLERQRIEQTADTLADKTERAARRQELQHTAYVHVTGVARAGVNVQIGSYSHVLTHDVDNVRFVLDPETRTVSAKKDAR